MLDRVRAYIELNQMLQRKDTVVVGVSGGPDSVCLLHILNALRADYDLSLNVVHVNHRLRKEAEAEAEFVKGMCNLLQVPFFLVEEDVESLAKETGKSVEEAGRELRYAEFGRILNQQGGKGKIAVAHHANDRAETLLFNIARGSGLEGMTSIRPVNDNIIRPLLCLTREEIEEYLEENHLEYCIDKSNEDDKYTRNKIRKHIIPRLQEVNNKAVVHMSECSDRLLEISEFLRDYVEDKYKQTVCQNTNELTGKSKIGCESDLETTKLYIDLKMLSEQPEFIQKEIIKKAVYQACQKKKDITSKHFDSIYELSKKNGNGCLDLPYDLQVIKSYEKITLQNKSLLNEDEKNKNSESIRLIIPGKTVLENGSVIECKLYKKSELTGEKIAPNQYTKCFDYAKIKMDLYLRTRGSGDVIQSMEIHEKKLSRFLLDEKVDKSKRDNILFIAEGNRVLWLFGYRIAQDRKITESTEDILEIKIINPWWVER